MTKEAIEARQDPTGVTSKDAIRVPEYRRDLFPRNLVVSAADIRKICELVSVLNDVAVDLEKSSIPEDDENREEKFARIDELMRIQYEYTEDSGNYVVGSGLPDTDGRQFPDGLQSFYVSNSSYSMNASKRRPLNCVDIFIDFSTPNLWLDLTSSPSQPTPNKSVINIYGRDENWVVSANTRISDLLSSCQSRLSFVHGAGTYEQFTYLLYIPLVVIFSMYLGLDQKLRFLDTFSFPMQLLISIWMIILSLMIGRQVFQYLRWLMPPMEYYKNKRTVAYGHRIILGFVFGGLFVAALYDVLKGLFS